MLPSDSPLKTEMSVACDPSLDCNSLLFQFLESCNVGIGFALGFFQSFFFLKESNFKTGFSAVTCRISDLCKELF